MPLNRSEELTGGFMRKNQKDALLLAKKLGRCSNLDFLTRDIPISAVDALVRKGLLMATQGLVKEYVLTEEGRSH